MVDKIVDCGNIMALADIMTRVSANRGSERPLIATCQKGKSRFVLKIVEYDIISTIIRHSEEQKAKEKSPGVEYLPTADAEIKAMRLMRKRIIRRAMSPCIIELLSVKICEGCAQQGKNIGERDVRDFASGTPENALAHKLAWCYNMHKRGTLYDKLAFIAMEVCDATFEAFIYYIRSDAIGRAIMKGVIWMIVYTIHVLQQEFPGIRHNDLHISNIMIYTDTEYSISQGIKYIEFEADKKYYIPFFGMLPKIIDFGHVSMPSEGFASEGTLYPYFRESKNDNDLNTFFSSIHSSLVNNADAFMSDMHISRLIDALSPKKYHSKMLQEADDKFPTPLEMLNNPIFAEYHAPVSESLIYSRYSSKSTK